MTVLFQCEPYRTKLTTQACARRYRSANTRRGQAGYGLRIGAGASCRTCPVGKAHSAGREGAEAVHVEPRPSGLPAPPPRAKFPRHAVKPAKVEPKPKPAKRPAAKRAPALTGHAPRECPCGTTFVPTGPRQVFCFPDCSARATHDTGQRAPGREYGVRLCATCGERYTATSPRQKRCATCPRVKNQRVVQDA